MPRLIHHDRMVNLFRRALHGGAKRRSLSHAEWDISGNCLSTYWTEVRGRPRANGEDGFYTYKPGRQFTMRVDIGTRCRKCDKCRQARRNEWRYRVRDEVGRASRSWFGTLTLAPAEQYRMLSAARAHAQSTAVPWNTLSDEERFKRVANTSLKEVTKYLKRVRKEAAVPFRYIVVTERHKSGLPHFHILIHESEFKPVRHKTLSSQWHMGFEKWKLLPLNDPRAGDYVTKYIAKDAVGRVRASIRYGKLEARPLVGGLLAAFQENHLVG